MIGAIIVTASVLFTNQNILTTTMPPPNAPTFNEQGEAFGTLQDGTPYSQTNVVNDFTRLQRFQVSEAWWYVSDKGVIGVGDGLSELEALSIYLTL